MKHIRSGLAIIGISALALLAACETTGDWTKKGVTEEQATRDYLSCREAVRSLAKRDADIDHDIAAARGQSDLRAAAETRTLKRGMDNYSDERREERLMEDCMEARGYNRVGS